jgi:hypothetical protein
MKDIKDNKTEFLITRVTKEEKEKVEREAQYSKNVSDFIRHKLGLDK